MESIFDLPAHVFAVHAPVVLEPLLALLTVVVMARPAWRERFGWWLVGGVVIVIVSVLIAMSSGEAFDDLLAGQVDVSKHESLATTTRNLMFGWLVALVALVVLDRRHRSASPSPDAPETSALRFARPGLAGVVAIVAVLATVWMIRTGHEGARVTWSGVIEANR